MQPMGGRPVVLVHGILGQRHLYWNLFRRRLAADGLEVHEAVLPYYLLGDLSAAATHLATQVAAIATQAGSRVDLVCHSAGGLVARVALGQVDEHVGHIVTMGTAHGGTHAAHVLAALPFVPMAAQARPGSEFIARAAAQPVDPHRFHCLWSPVDGIVLPSRNAMLPGADNVELPWTGHWMFLWSSRVYEVVASILASDPFQPARKPRAAAGRKAPKARKGRTSPAPG